MMIAIKAGGPEYDTAISLSEQAPEVVKAINGVMFASPFDKTKSTSESCGKMNWPKSGKFPELLRWPRRVWATDSALVCQTVVFQYPVDDAACMAEASSTITVEPLS